MKLGSDELVAAVYLPWILVHPKPESSKKGKKLGWQGGWLVACAGGAALMSFGQLKGGRAGGQFPTPIKRVGLLVDQVKLGN